jgi:hypothetical protein
MSATYIKAELRRMVEVRANGICEYCLIADDDTYVGCQVDHIISLKQWWTYRGRQLSACLFDVQSGEGLRHRLDLLANWSICSIVQPAN